MTDLASNLASAADALDAEAAADVPTDRASLAAFLRSCAEEARLLLDFDAVERGVVTLDEFLAAERGASHARH